MELLLLGVDGGGTHTRAVLATSAGAVLGVGSAGPSNQATAGAGPAQEALRAAIRAATASAVGRVDAACLGLAGLDRPQDEAAYLPVLSPLGLGEGTLLVNDSVVAWAGATGGEPGLALVAGTGSVAYGAGPDGVGLRAGGWGLPVGDEGGAAWIAAEAIRRVLRGLDGRDPPSGLADILCTAAGLDDPADLCRLSGEAGGLEAALGALAPALTLAAAQGQPEAAVLMQEAGRQLAELALALAGRLGLNRPAVHALGSVLGPEHPDFPFTPVARVVDRVLRQRCGVPLMRPRHAATVGALALAHRARLGRWPDPAVATAWGAARC